GKAKAPRTLTIKRHKGKKPKTSAVRQSPTRTGKNHPKTRRAGTQPNSAPTQFVLYFSADP
ncbi:hypothetical protein, partial [Paraburkholderia aspalathi]